jgi:zinc/manganese transport system permease protein
MMTIEFLLTPFVAVVILILINVYFGLHVIKREIIFIDIALAQIAALGSTLALILFNMLHPQAALDHEETNAFTYCFSLAFVLLAALMFTLMKNKRIPVPLEAIIGITYAVSTTGAVIILDKGAGGDVHIHDMLIGSILWVSWHQITRLFVAAVIAGIIHFVFREKFIKLSDNYLNNGSKLKNAALWDFLFYFTFGIVVIEAVNVAGILTVFALLIIPSSISTLATNNWRNKLWIGWSASIVSAILGLYISWKIDIPASPVIIVLLALELLIVFVFQRSLSMRKA